MMYNSFRIFQICRTCFGKRLNFLIWYKIIEIQLRNTAVLLFLVPYPKQINIKQCFIETLILFRGWIIANYGPKGFFSYWPTFQILSKLK